MELAAEGPGRSERFAESVDKEPPGLTRILVSLAVSFPELGGGFRPLGPSAVPPPPTHSGVRTSAGETYVARSCAAVYTGFSQLDIW